MDISFLFLKQRNIYEEFMGEKNLRIWNGDFIKANRINGNTSIICETRDYFKWACTFRPVTLVLEACPYDTLKKMASCQDSMMKNMIVKTYGLISIQISKQP